MPGGKFCQWFPLQRDVPLSHLSLPFCSLELLWRAHQLLSFHQRSTLFHAMLSFRKHKDQVAGFQSFATECLFSKARSWRPQPSQWCRMNSHLRWALTFIYLKAIPNTQNLWCFSSSNIILLSSENWTSWVTWYLTQCQPPVISLEGQIYIYLFCKWELAIACG